MSSSTIVCRNYTSSCFDPHENTATTTLKLKVLVHQNPNHQTSLEDLGSFQTHPNKSHYSQNDAHHQYSCNNTMKTYNSFSRLSPKSLELCTENLGSETGSDTMFIATANINQEPVNNHKLVPDSEISKTNVRKFQKSPCDRTVKNTKNCTFPPPLTTLSGSSPLQVTRHRENGRLIIEAVERPLRNRVLQAERGGGRLRLSFLSTPAVEELRNEAEAFVDRDDGVNNDNRRNKNNQWISRCKEGGHSSDHRGDDMNWNKPAFWVATS